MQNKSGAVTITVILISVSLIVANYLVNNLVVNSSWFRKSIDPNNYIDGYWYEISPTDSNNFKPHVNLIKIEYSNGTYSLNGEAYDMRGRPYANFSSTISTYNNRQYLLEYESLNNDHGVGHGIDQFQFDNPPTTYKGFVFSETKRKYYPMEGIRVTEDQQKRYNNFSSIIDKKKFITDILKSLKASN